MKFKDYVLTEAPVKGGKPISAGLLMYHQNDAGDIFAFLVKPGGPFFYNNGGVGIPKGRLDGDERPLDAAIREFEEETGIKVPEGTDFIELGKSEKHEKIVQIWAFKGTGDENFISSNTFERDGKEYPENDGGAYFKISVGMNKNSYVAGDINDNDIEIAGERRKWYIFPIQSTFLVRLANHLKNAK